MFILKVLAMVRVLVRPLDFGLIHVMGANCDWCSNRRFDTVFLICNLWFLVAVWPRL